MALIFCDGFDHYNSVSLMARKWSTASVWTFTTGRFGGSAITKSSGQIGSCSLGIPATTTLIVGFAFKINAFTSENRLCALKDGATLQDELFLKTDGRLEVRRNGTVLATSANPIPLDTWIYIEWKVTIDNASGVSQVRLNGSSAPVINFSGDTQNTANATANTVDVTPGQNGVPVFDDFYICDTSGSFNNDFLGDARIKAVFPDGAGNYTEWTPSAGSNYQAVDENPPDDDTTYVSSSTPNQRDTYTFGASGLPSSTVKAVVVNMQARKDDGGTREIAGMARSSSTDGVAATQTLASSYANYQGIFETDPNTSAAWGLSAVDGAEFGHKLIT